MQPKKYTHPKACDTLFLGGTESIASLDTPLHAAEAPTRELALTPTKADLVRDDLSDFSIGPYQLADRIGRGGMGVVYRAQHKSLGKWFAIKFIAHTALHDASVVQRFEQEIFALGQLQHPHIINAIDAGTIHGIPYYVTELLQGADLQDRVVKQSLPPWEAACELIVQTARGLDFAHQAGFVHRDIKPSNLYLDHQGQLKILDFGLVLSQGANTSLTTSGQLLGTVDYFSPEQAEDPHRCTEVSDLYSLGAVFHFLLFGEPPFPDADYPTLVSKVRGHLVDVPLGLRQPSKHLPETVQALIKRLLAKSCRERPQTCGEVIAALTPYASRRAVERWLAPTNSVPATDHPDPHHAAAVHPKSPKRIWMGLSGSILALLLILGLYLQQGSIASSDLAKGDPTSRDAHSTTPNASSDRVPATSQVPLTQTPKMGPETGTHNASVLQVDLGLVPRTSAGLRQKTLRSLQP